MASKEAGTVDGSCTEASFNNAIQRAIAKLPSNVTFEISQCIFKDGKLTVNLEYQQIVKTGQ